MDSFGLRYERLTRRENDVLTLLGENLTDREIVERLVLSLHTVKWYTRQIYGKLGVANRREAVSRARELGLLAREPLAKRATQNLPHQLNSFIGREKEIYQVVKMIGEYPLVTLTGAGGVGKTRLAQMVAQKLLDDFADGIWYVEFAALFDPQLVVRTLAAVIGVREEPSRPLLEAIYSYFNDRQALLVIDNCEHMITACAALVHDLLTHLPDLKVITTSREPLGLDGEVLFRVPSLTFPEDLRACEVEDCLTYEAVRLFVERTQTALSEYRLTSDNVASVVEICRRLDGIPLAIELAATRTRLLSVEQIAERLDQAFILLTGGSRTALPRHQTLKAMIDWSYDLLSPEERTLMMRLSVFAGGWTLEAAETMCADDASEDFSDVPALEGGRSDLESESGPGGPQKVQIVDLLGSLVDKSLVHFEPVTGAQPRYRMLETVRQYARQRLVECGGEVGMRERHRDYYLALGMQAEPHLRARQAKSWMDRLDRELENIRLALEYACSTEVEKGLQLSAALCWFWCARSHWTEGKEWLERLLREQEQQRDPHSLDLIARVARGRAINVLSLIINQYNGMYFNYFVHDKTEMEQESIAIFQALGDEYQRDYAIARFNRSETAEDFLECRNMFQAIKDPFWTAECDMHLCMVYAPDDERVVLYNEESLTLRTEIGDMEGQAYALVCLGYSALVQGNVDLFVDLTLEGLAVYEMVGNREYAASIHSGLAQFYTVSANYPEAIRHAESLLVVARESGDRRLLFIYQTHLARIAWCKKEYQRSIHYSEEALVLSKEYSLNMKVSVLYLLSRAYLSQGKEIQARVYLKEICKSELFKFDWNYSFLLLQALGIMAVQEEWMELAATWFGTQDAISSRHSWLVSFTLPLERAKFEQALAAARAALDEETFHAAWEAGRAMTVDQVFQLAQEVLA